MYDKVMTLWTFSKDQDSTIIDEAFSLNCEGKFAYKNMPLMKDGKHLFLQ